MKTADGKKSFGSAFRAHRYDREHEGPRAEAHQMGVNSAAMPEEQEEALEEQVHPGIHDEIQQVAAEHGPAHEIHMQHDHEGGVHHVTTHHPDGYVHEADHPSAEHAHTHAAHAAGLAPPEEPEEEAPEHHSPKPKKAKAEEKDEYEPEALPD